MTRLQITRLIAELHHPLQTGYGDERDGNLCQVQAFGRSTNLQADWNRALVAQWQCGVRTLMVSVDPKSAPLGNTDPIV